jgi:hypothetical protein
MTAALVCAATFLVTAGHAHLPHTMLDPVHFSSLRIYIAGFQVLLGVAAFMVLWIRRHSVLDLWLMVVMCAYVIEVCLIAFPVPARFSVGWYAGRVFGLVSGSLVLFVLLYEITILYGQLLLAVRAQLRAALARIGRDGLSRRLVLVAPNLHAGSDRLVLRPFAVAHHFGGAPVHEFRLAFTVTRLHGHHCLLTTSRMEKPRVFRGLVASELWLRPLGV